MDNNKEIVRAIIAEVTEVELEQVKNETRFVEDLEADSLKALELFAVLEQKFKVKIPESNLKRFTTLNNTMEVLQEVMSTVNAAK